MPLQGAFLVARKAYLAVDLLGRSTSDHGLRANECSPSSPDPSRQPLVAYYARDALHEARQGPFYARMAKVHGGQGWRRSSRPALAGGEPGYGGRGRELQRVGRAALSTSISGPRRWSGWRRGACSRQPTIRRGKGCCALR